MMLWMRLEGGEERAKHTQRERERKREPAVVLSSESTPKSRTSRSSQWLQERSGRTARTSNALAVQESVRSEQGARAHTHPHTHMRNR